MIIAPALPAIAPTRFATADPTPAPAPTRTEVAAAMKQATGAIAMIGMSASFAPTIGATVADNLDKLDPVLVKLTAAARSVAPDAEPTWLALDQVTAGLQNLSASLRPQTTPVDAKLLMELLTPAMTAFAAAAALLDPSIVTPPPAPLTR